VNGSRQDAGVSSLPVDPRAQAVASEHAVRMRDAGRIYHNPNVARELDARGVDWDRWGENVGVGPSTSDVHTGFMNSPTHKANVLDARYNAIGTGTAVAGNGRVYVAQVFVTLNAQPQPAPAAPAAHAVQEAPAASEPQDTEVASESHAQPAASAPPAGYVRAEDGSLVPPSFYSTDHCHSAYVMAEDGTIVPLWFYGEAPNC
jgi:hypothetical protein